MFNNEYYLKWFKILLDNLPTDRKCVIILDNAKYHLAKPEGSFTATNKKKAELIEFLNSPDRSNFVQNNNIQVNNLLATQLKEWCNKWISENIQLAVVAMAKERGHDVLFTPPYHSDLQPIELIWAQIKKTVAKKYNQNTTFKEVLVSLNQSFNDITAEYWTKCINHVIKEEEVHRERDLATDDILENEENNEEYEKDDNIDELLDINDDNTNENDSDDEG